MENKRKRGRPKKQELQLPDFKSDSEIRNYILNASLKLSLECKEIAMKKNNIKKPALANAKNQQFKTAISSLKVANDILKDKQLNDFEERLKLLETTIVNSTTFEDVVLDSKTINKIEKLSEISEQLATLKT